MAKTVRKQLAELTELVQHLERGEQVTAWRLERLEQQLTLLKRLLVGMTQIYQDERVEEWRNWAGGGRQYYDRRRRINSRHDIYPSPTSKY